MHSVLVAAGLSVVIAASATAFTILKTVGTVYLTYLAYDAIAKGSPYPLTEVDRMSACMPSISKD